MLTKQKVFLLISEAAPYRLPLFERLSQEVTLHVYFSKAKSKNRLWNSSIKEYTFKYTILKSLSLCHIIINPFLVFRLLFNHYHIYIVDDDPRLTFSKLLTFFIAKLLRRPIIVWSGLTGKDYYNKVRSMANRYLLHPIRRLIYCHADAFIAYGKEAKEFLIKNGALEKDIYVGTQAMPQYQLKVQDKSVTKNYLGFWNKKIILFVGYFTKYKGVIELIEAYKQLTRDDTVLVMVGAGKEEGRLKSLASDREDIYFPGYLEGLEKDRYYAIADIFVLPTFLDPWGLVINEAMMFGLPVITTEGAGAKELIRGNGIVIKEGDVRTLKEAMEYLLDHDPIRTEMGIKSKEIIKEYTIERVKKTFIDAIENVKNLD